MEERRWINELIREANQVTSEMCGYSVAEDFFDAATRAEKREYIPISTAKRKY